MAICHPFKNIHFRTKSSRVILTILISWIMAFTAAGPMGLEFTIHHVEYPDWLDPESRPNEPVYIKESAVCTPRTDGPMV